ncbi:MAG: hypothetical protein LBB66_08570 [Desulfovibrio sp.]|nr:hypothetical protein [Desulfovibrio sp.]
MSRLHAMGEGRRGHRHAGFFPEGGEEHCLAPGETAGAGRGRERGPHGERAARDIPARCLQCPHGKARPCPPGKRCFD